MTVIGVFAQANVGDYVGIGRRFFDCSHRLLNRLIGRSGLRPGSVLLIGNAEEQDGFDPRLVRFLRLFDSHIDRHLVDTWHWLDWSSDTGAVDDEHRVDEL